jgi:hypothetical protein
LVLKVGTQPEHERTALSPQERGIVAAGSALVKAWLEIVVR